MSERVVVRYPLFYSPLPFVPQAFAIAIGDALHLRPLIAFYLGRLLNLAAALSLIALAFRLFASPVLATCALLPMTLFLFASFSSDAITIAMTFLATALALAGSPWIIVASLALGLCKPAYVLVPLVVLASRRRWIAATTLVAVIAGVGSFTGGLMSAPVDFTAPAPPKSALLLDASGQVFATVRSPYQRQEVPASDIPQAMRDAWQTWRVAM